MAKTIAEQVQLLKRGTVEIFTEAELAEKLTESAKAPRQLRIKLGLDPTSPDIHLGHTVVLRKMRQFQDLGHKAVLIIGDYTARIGDPAGQNATRPILSPEQIQENAKTYFEQAGKILNTSEEKLEIRYNSEWLEKLTLMELIQIAATKTVAQMLQRDTFKKRLQADVDVYTHEFLYPLMQGYDSVMVKSDVELGGTDQTFNNLVGRDIQKAYGQKPQIVITVPILVGLDGKEKMSKSKDNYIGVTDEPNDMFGKVMSISDDMMENYFTLLTDMPTEKIAELVNPNKTHPKQAKVLLGKTIVSQFYNEPAAQAAAAEFDKVFAQGQLPDDMPEFTLPEEVISVKQLLLASKLVETGGEAKRMCAHAAVSINEMLRPMRDFAKQIEAPMRTYHELAEQIQRSREPIRNIGKQIEEGLRPMREFAERMEEQAKPIRDFSRQMEQAVAPMRAVVKQAQKSLERLGTLFPQESKLARQATDGLDELIKQTEVIVNGVKITDPNQQIMPKDGMVIRVGKRKFARLKVNI